MRRAFTLIEIIFTIVIMAGIFAVIPKIIFATNKSENFAMKQDAFFNTISLTKIASSLAWDENNTQTLSILDTNSSNTDLEDCNQSTSRRNGGVLGEDTRNCTKDFSASTIGKDAGELNYLYFDDIDDFNGTVIDVNLSNRAKYEINTTVSYINDTIIADDGTNTMIIDLSNASVSTTSTNIKKFKATAKNVGRGKKGNIASFYYYSTNIGQITLDSEIWR